jgi:FAD/FMN-containing dehydrogenase
MGSDRVPVTAATVHNFGRNVAFIPAVRAEPQDEQELLDLLNRHRGLPVRVLASGHSWSDAIKTSGLLVSVNRINHVRVDPSQGTVRVGAGCRIRCLVSELQKHGLTLPSIGLIDEQTVAGATATGTHGSGRHSLSHYVKRVRVAHYDNGTGEAVLREIDGGPELQAARCSLGLLGVIVELEMQVRPQYNVQEHARRWRSMPDLLQAEEDYPLQQFYLMPWSWHWFGQHRKETQRPRSRSAGLYRAYWHWGIDWGLHLVICLLVRILGARWLIRGFYRYMLPLVIARRWYVTDRSDRILVMEHELFRHIEIEFFVTRARLPATLEYLRQTLTVFGGRPWPGPVDSGLQSHEGTYCHHYPICVRRVLADDTLISMACPPDSGGLASDWYAISLISYDRPDRRSGFFEFAAFLARQLPRRFGARCHWGKYNPLDRSDNEHLYPQLPRFREVASALDGDSRFANRWLRETLLPESAGEAF